MLKRIKAEINFTITFTTETLTFDPLIQTIGVYLLTKHPLIYEVALVLKLLGGNKNIDNHLFVMGDHILLVLHVQDGHLMMGLMEPKANER